MVKPLHADFDPNELLGACRRDLPNFMVPLEIVVRADLPRNPNGKIDRRAIANELADRFTLGALA